MTSLVELSNICVQFDERKVLDNVSVSLKNGEITTLIGPNGAGKSTLVKVLLGLQRCSEGTITKPKGLKIGYVPQKLKLNDSLPLDVARFLRLAGRYSQQEIQDSLSLVGAAHLAKANMHSLSGGETQRVLLSRALLQRPQLLVLDEPAQGVDVQGQIDLYDLIDTIRHRFHCAVFMVSHDLHLVMAKTDHVICLQQHICCSGTPAAIVQHPKYLALFGQANQEAIAFYHHQHDHHHHDLAGQPVEGERSRCSHHSHGHRPHD